MAKTIIDIDKSEAAINKHNGGLYKEIRRAIGVSEEELGAYLGLDADTIRQREAGEVKITREMILAIEQTYAIHGGKWEAA